MDIHKYDTWLFDVDDTLIDFAASMERSLKKCYEEFFSSISFEAFKSHYHTVNDKLWGQVEQGEICPGTVSQKRFERLADLLGHPIDQEVRIYYEGLLVENSDWIEGAVELLETLVRTGAQIGFITNGFKEVQRKKVEHLGFSRFSRALVISEEFGHSKPDPRIFHHTLDQLGAYPEKTLMIGDSLTSDGEGARKAGLAFCWYNPNKHPGPSHWAPDFEIAHLSELPR